MNTVFVLDDAEIREIFRMMRNTADDAHYVHHPIKSWPLYDRIAEYLGENSLEKHNEALRLRDEEELDDEWRSSVGSDSEASEGF